MKIPFLAPSQDSSKSVYRPNWCIVLGPERSEEPITLDHFDFFVFHSPFANLVKKSFGRLMYNDFVKETQPGNSTYADVEKFRWIYILTHYIHCEVRIYEKIR